MGVPSLPQSRAAVQRVDWSCRWTNFSEVVGVVEDDRLERTNRDNSASLQQKKTHAHNIFTLNLLNRRYPQSHSHEKQLTRNDHLGRTAHQLPSASCGLQLQTVDRCGLLRRTTQPGPGAHRAAAALAQCVHPAPPPRALSFALVCAFSTRGAPSPSITLFRRPVSLRFAAR